MTDIHIDFFADAHIWSNRIASSAEQIMFLGLVRKLGLKAALWYAVRYDWDYIPVLIAVVAHRQ